MPRLSLPCRGPCSGAGRGPRGPVRRPRGLFLAAAFVTLCAPLPGTARADEGMYLLHEADRLPWPALRRRGLALGRAQLAGLAPAVVQLARGGTGSFVSPRGLIVTNHHVAYRCLVRLDGTTHPGLLARGYLAAAQPKELPCPGYDALVVVRVEDATQRILGGLPPSLDPKARALRIRVARRRLEAQCERAGGRGTVCAVDALNGGAGFTLSVYRRIRDVRLVYAPPKALGKFGGDVDNWRYPRHTADFTFLRAYVSPRGDGAPYAKSNVPFRPARWLRVATSGVRRGQITLVLGFPGRTRRHATLARARFWRDHLMARKARLFRYLLRQLPRTGLDGRRYAGLEASLHNAAKYYEDSIAQFARFRFLERKARQQQGWLRRAGPRAPALRRLLARIDGIYRRYDAIADRMLLLGYLQSRILRSLSTAVDIVRWSRLRRVPDLRREGERYRDKNLYRVRRQARSLDALVTRAGERQVLRALVGFARRLPPPRQPKLLAWLERYGRGQLARLRRAAKRRRIPLAQAYREATGGPAPADPLLAAVDLIYARTRLLTRNPQDARATARSRRLRLRWLRAPAARVRRARDPLLALARQVVAEHDALRAGPGFEMERVLGPILRPRLVTEFIRPRYWDANFTLRLSYGTVKDYRESATGKRWRYLSRLTWLVRKGRGKYPFLVPAPLRAIYARRDFGPWVDPNIRDVPVNFTSTLDTTGGNSGSPVLNGRGELVGLLFDGTPESILSDWQYLDAAQRSICVDIRFVLFLADRLDHADALLRELGIRRSRGPRAHGRARPR